MIVPKIVTIDILYETIPNWLLAKLSVFKWTRPPNAWSSNTFNRLLSSLNTSRLMSWENAFVGMEARLFWLRSNFSKGMLQFWVNPNSLASCRKLTDKFKNRRLWRPQKVEPGTVHRLFLVKFKLRKLLRPVNASASRIENNF